MNHMLLTSLGRPDCDHLVGLVQLAEALGEYFDMIGGVWFQHSEFVAGLVAMGVHDGPLLSANEPKHKR